MMYVGHPKGDSGSAFVISRKHRLLATNAHVAQIMEEAGAMVAVPNGSNQIYPVERVWYHPDFARVWKEGVDVRAGGRWRPYRGLLGPDLAVLQLSADGPRIEAECRLAGPEQLGGLSSEPVGTLGFSGAGPPPGLPMLACFRAGTVSLLTEFSAPWDRSRVWTMVDFTAHVGSGNSGGPVFLRDGRVIAVFAWSRKTQGGGWDEGRETSAGILVNGLWELLDYHGLKGLICPEIP